MSINPPQAEYLAILNKNIYLTGVDEKLRHSFSKLDVFSLVPEQNQMLTRIDSMKAIEQQL